MVRISRRRVNFAQHFVAIVLDEQHLILGWWSVYHHVRKEMFTCASKILHGLFEPHERCPSLGDAVLDSGGRGAILNLYPLLCK